MSFIGKAVGKIAQVVGLAPKPPQMPALPMPPVMSAADTSAATDAAAQKQAAAMMGGRTSTILTGGMGEDENLLKTSKVLLGQ